MGVPLASLGSTLLLATAKRYGGAGSNIEVIIVALGVDLTF
jgi:hypothetical protein